MGAYLSEPVTEKYSNDEGNEYMDVGASSMQGWRISQEDAHNCILNFDKNTSFFSVFDGHGGAEVAAYCAEKLPEFLKGLKAYQDGDFEQALKDAFLGFDATLLDEEIIEVLKKLAVEKNPDKESELADEEEEEDLVELCQEGCLPIEQVLEKYKGCAARFPQLIRIKKDDAGASGSGTSKPLSPFLRGRRNPVLEICEENLDGPSCSSSSQRINAGDSKMETDNIDSAVSSSSSKTDNSTAKVEESGCKDMPLLYTGNKKSSSTSLAKLLAVRKVQNGDISSCQDKEDIPASSSSKIEDVSSSSSTTPGALTQVPSSQENGEVSSLSSSLPTSNKIRQVIGGSGEPGNITSSTNEGKNRKSLNPGLHDEEDTSSSDDDADFHAEENSSTEDGEEDGEPGDEDTEEENEEDETEDEDGAMEGNFFANASEEPGKDSGCTAVVTLLHGRDLYVANAGDSRCVVCRKGKAVEMSFDHKPEDEEECARIFKAGGKVTLDGRVNGGLNLSRAIGDHSYKMNKDLPPEMQMISAMPDVRKLIISPDDEFMILACDGIWNFMSSDDVVDYVKKRISEGQEKMSQICEELFDNCLAPNTMGDGTGCDNMTALIVRFKPKIFELPTRLTAESEAVPAISSSKRRCSSPVPNSENEEYSENSSKRLKTDDDKPKECDSGSSTSDPASTSQPTTTT